MKAKLALVAVLVAVLALTGVGCTKATGGGWFTNNGPGPNYGHRITFGFNAHHDSEDGSVKGQLQLIDHDAKINIHGQFDGTTTYGTKDFLGQCWVKFVVQGEGTVNGEGPYYFKLVYSDKGEPGANPDNPLESDSITVWVSKTWPVMFPYEYWYTGNLEGGNIQYHEK